METHNNQEQLEAFVKKYVKEIPLEEPSDDFTNQVMSKIEAQQSSLTKYVPLIGWKIWSLVVLVLSALFFIPFQKSENPIFDKVTLDIWIKSVRDQLPNFSGLSVSDTTSYAFLFFAIMMVIQIYYLKNYFSKRYDM